MVGWEIETNKMAQYPLADTDITDTIYPLNQSISAYYGEGVTVKCFTVSGSQAETRFLTWEELGVDLDTGKSWTYHIPDTDPNYRYVLTYETIVDVDGQTDTVVIENIAEGKGGIDSDRAVLPPLGTSGIGIIKNVVDQDSTHVTWEITLTVRGTAFDYTQLCLTEHSGSTTKNGVATWSTDTLPVQWINVPNADGVNVSTMFKETLKKVEVVGLENGETFKVAYSKPTSANEYNYFSPPEGSGVLEADFGGYRWGGDKCQIWFYKDYAQTEGNLRRPSGDEDSRSITIRLYTEFPETWATSARDYMLANATRNSGIYSHVNWITAETPDSSGQMRVRASDTDKITPMPPHVYKTVLENPDSTIASASQRQKFILNYHNPIIRSWNPTETGRLYPDEVVYPTFRYQVIVSGIQYDEPLVIEDTFDTELLDCITSEKFDGGRYLMTENGRQWTHTYMEGLCNVGIRLDTILKQG